MENAKKITVEKLSDQVFRIDDGDLIVGAGKMIAAVRAKLGIDPKPRPPKAE